MSVEVCCGDPNKSAFEGSQGWTLRTGKQAHADFSCCQRICMSELVLSFSHCGTFVTWFPAFWALCLQDYASPWTKTVTTTYYTTYDSLSDRLQSMQTHTHTRNTIQLNAKYTKYSQLINSEEHNKLNGTYFQQRAVSCEGICALHIYQSDSRRQGYRSFNITTYSLMAYTATDHYPSQHSTALHNAVLHSIILYGNPLSPSIALAWLQCEVCRR